MKDYRSPLRHFVYSLPFLFCLMSAGTLQAQTTYQVGFGYTDILDTYLSQEKFTGKASLNFLTTREVTSEGQSLVGCAGSVCQPLRPYRWASLVQNQVHFSTAKDRAENDAIIEAMYNFYYGRYYNLGLGGPFSLRAGGLGTAGLGFIYNTRNSNNPVNARLGLQVMPSVIAGYHFRLIRWSDRGNRAGHVNLRYQADMPLVGVVFSPNYGQSYYELFSLGNYDHNIVPTTFVSQPTFRQQFTVEYNASNRLVLTVGYLGDYQQLKVNNLKQHVYNHALMVGFMTR